MLIKRLDDILTTERDVKADTWNSRRLLLKDDQMGFSMHDTIMFAGTSTRMWYQHHLEAVYCIEGEGEVQDLASEEVYPVSPGTLYALDKNDRHILTAKTQMRVICVFNPPVTGNETHDDNGAYPLLEKALR